MYDKSRAFSVLNYSMAVRRKNSKVDLWVVSSEPTRPGIDDLWSTQPVPSALCLGDKSLVRYFGGPKRCTKFVALEIFL